MAAQLTQSTYSQTRNLARSFDQISIDFGAKAQDRTLENIGRELLQSLQNTECSVEDRFKGLSYVARIRMYQNEQLEPSQYAKRKRDENLDSLKGLLEEIEKTSLCFSRSQLGSLGIDYRNYSGEQMKYSPSGFVASRAVFQDLFSREMVRNFQEVYQETLEDEKIRGDNFFILPDALERLPKTGSRIDIEGAQVHEGVFQGGSSRIKEAAFSLKLSQGILAGIFSENSGAEGLIVNRIKELSMSVFPSILSDVKGDVALALSTLVHRITSVFLEDNRSARLRLVLSFVTRRGEVYTAALGENRALLYKKTGERQLGWLPLSNSKREGGGDLISLGDGIVSYKLAITKQFVQPGDSLILASRGACFINSPSTIGQILKPSRSKGQMRLHPVAAMVENAKKSMIRYVQPESCPDERRGSQFASAGALLCHLEEAQGIRPEGKTSDERVEDCLQTFRETYRMFGNVSAVSISV